MPRRADGTRPHRFALVALVIAALVAGGVAALGTAVGTHAPNAIAAAPPALPGKSSSSLSRPSVPNDDAFAFFAQGGSNCTAPVTTVTIVGTAPPEPIELCINPGVNHTNPGL